MYDGKSTDNTSNSNKYPKEAKELNRKKMITMIMIIG